ncbi:MAG: transcriptional repressor [Muribaculaceae bacterium]|nr:transcriptional repressor [Muribaculaceae bacterium]
MHSKRTTASAEEKFDDYLRQHHRRRTDERKTILHTVMKLDGHFTAEDLCARMREADYPVSVATVYSTLELLVDCGLVVKQRFSEKATCYEVASAGSSPTHHHLICSVCGKIKEVRDSAITDLLNSRRYTGFSPRSYALTIYGICTACSRKSKNKKSQKTHS